MNEPIRHTHPVLEQFTATIAGKGHLDGDTRRGEASPDRRDAVGRNLESVRSCIDEAIGSCVRRESQGDLIEVDDRGQFVPHHLTEIDSLQRLRHHLDRLATRYRAARSTGAVHVASDPLHARDLALAECAGAMVRRFEVPDVRHDLLADLEADLCHFERLLDEWALRDPEGGPEQHRGGADVTGEVPAAGRMEAARDDGARPGRGKDLFLTLEEYREVLRRVDRHIAEAEGNPPLQGFWREVKRKSREEADRLTRSIGEATIPLSMIEV